jgi:hypothetical protein
LQVVAETVRTADDAGRRVGDGLLRLLGAGIRGAAVFVGGRRVPRGAAGDVFDLGQQPVVGVVAVGDRLVDRPVAAGVVFLQQAVAGEVVVVAVDVVQQVVVVVEDLVGQPAAPYKIARTSASH